MLLGVVIGALIFGSGVVFGMALKTAVNKELE